MQQQARTKSRFTCFFRLLRYGGVMISIQSIPSSTLFNIQHATHIRIYISSKSSITAPNPVKIYTHTLISRCGKAPYERRAFSIGVGGVLWCSGSSSIRLIPAACFFRPSLFYSSILLFSIVPSRGLPTRTSNLSSVKLGC